MDTETFVRRGGMTAYVSRASGRGRCAICGNMIEKRKAQLVVQSPNAGARQHLWCVIKAILKSLPMLLP